jgi:hypothetical protein
MSRNEILSVFKQLALSQGFYGRLLRNLDNLYVNSPDMYEELMLNLESQKFADTVDLILYIEG